MSIVLKRCAKIKPCQQR